jgi:hypothetical protein
MALASLPITTVAAFAGCARRIETTATASVIVLDDGRRQAVAARPDPTGAARCRRSFNHITSIRLEGTTTEVRARVRGIGNRLPVDLAIPVASALALIDAGVPAVVRLTDGGVG